VDLSLLWTASNCYGLIQDPEGRLLLSLNLYGPDDSLLMMISKNEWIAGDPLVWDLQYGFNQITLRRADRIISLDIDPRSYPLVAIEGEFWRKGNHFSIGRQIMTLNGAGKTINFRNVGLIANFFVVDTSTGSFRLDVDPRLKGAISGIHDPDERLKNGIATFHRLCHEAKMGRNEFCPCGSGRKLKHCHQAPDYRLPDTN
jgi:SEC-C motif